MPMISPRGQAVPTRLSHHLGRAHDRRTRKLLPGGAAFGSADGALARALVRSGLAALVLSAVAGCGTAPPRTLSVAWVPTSDYAKTCAEIKGASTTTEGCIVRSSTACTIITPAKKVSYEHFGGQLRECLGSGQST